MTAFLATLGLSFVIVALAIAAMSIGVMAGRSPIKGSCGGVSASGCTLCSGTCRRRDADYGDGQRHGRTRTPT